MREDSTMRLSAIRLILILALGILTAPLTAEAQQATKVHRIGWLSAGERDSYMEAFLEGMRTLGYVEGQNFVLEYRYAAGQYERLPALAAELVRLKVDVLVTAGQGALAAKHATATIPIVFA